MLAQDGGRSIDLGATAWNTSKWLHVVVGEVKTVSKRLDFIYIYFHTIYQIF